MEKWRLNLMQWDQWTIEELSALNEQHVIECAKPYKRTLNDRSPQELIEHVKKLRQSEKMETITEDMNLSDFEEEIEMPNEDAPAQEYCKLLLKEFMKLRKDIKGVKKEQWEQFKNNLDTHITSSKHVWSHSTIRNGK